MNNTGLYSGIYERLRLFSELLDGVLLDSESGTYDPIQLAGLGALFREVGETEHSNLPAQRLAMTLKDRLGKDAGHWAEVGDRIAGGDLSTDIIQDLQSAAKVLEHERARAYAKLRGAP